MGRCKRVARNLGGSSPSRCHAGTATCHRSRVDSAVSGAFELVCRNLIARKTRNCAYREQDTKMPDMSAGVLDTVRLTNASRPYQPNLDYKAPCFARNWTLGVSTQWNRNHHQFS